MKVMKSIEKGKSMKGGMREKAIKKPVIVRGKGARARATKKRTGGMKSMKKGGTGKKAKRIPVIARGKGAKRRVFFGKALKTAGRLCGSNLVENKRGKIVSEKKSKAGKENAWIKAVTSARKALDIVGFVLLEMPGEPKPGKEPNLTVGQQLYSTARLYYMNDKLAASAPDSPASSKKNSENGTKDKKATAAPDSPASSKKKSENGTGKDKKATAAPDSPASSKKNPENGTLLTPLARDDLDPEDVAKHWDIFFEIDKSEKGGDCFYECVAKALKDSFRDITINSLREIVSDKYSQDDFDELKKKASETPPKKELDVYKVATSLNDLRKRIMEGGKDGIPADDFAINALQNAFSVKFVRITSVGYYLLSGLDNGVRENKHHPCTHIIVLRQSDNNHYDLVKRPDVDENYNTIYRRSFDKKQANELFVFKLAVNKSAWKTIIPEFVTDYTLKVKKARENFYIDKCEPDGNCFYECVAKALKQKGLRLSAHDVRCAASNLIDEEDLTTIKNNLKEYNLGDSTTKSFQLDMEVDNQGDSTTKSFQRDMEAYNQGDSTTKSFQRDMEVYKGVTDLLDLRSRVKDDKKIYADDFVIWKLERKYNVKFVPIIDLVDKEEAFGLASRCSEEDYNPTHMIVLMKDNVHYDLLRFKGNGENDKGKAIFTITEAEECGVFDLVKETNLWKTGTFTDWPALRNYWKHRDRKNQSKIANEEVDEAERNETIGPQGKSRPKQCAGAQVTKARKEKENSTTRSPQAKVNKKSDRRKSSSSSKSSASSKSSSSSKRPRGTEKTEVSKFHMPPAKKLIVTSSKAN